MAAKPTDFHDPEKELKEYVIIPTDPEDGIDAVYCCRCVDESYCRIESNIGVVLYSYGSIFVYVNTN